MGRYEKENNSHINVRTDIVNILADQKPAQVQHAFDGNTIEKVLVGACCIVLGIAIYSLVQISHCKSTTSKALQEAKVDMDSKFNAECVKTDS